GLEDWSQHPDSKGKVTLEGPDHVWHVDWPGGNWSNIYQEHVLRPDTAYIYEADVKTTSPVVALYWQSDIGRFHEIDKTYDDWTHLTYVFITPHWDGQPKTTGFNPILMKRAGDAWLKGLRLSEFQPPKVP